MFSWAHNMPSPPLRLGITCEYPIIMTQRMYAVPNWLMMFETRYFSKRYVYLNRIDRRQRSIYFSRPYEEMAYFKNANFVLKKR